MLSYDSSWFEVYVSYKGIDFLGGVMFIPFHIIILFQIFNTVY